MTTLIKAAKQALEALENLFGIPDKFTGGGGDVAVWRLGGPHRAQQAITALRQAIGEAEKQDVQEVGFGNMEKPVQEPVAWESILGAVARGWCYEGNSNKTMDSDLVAAIAKEVQALYTASPAAQRQWVGLTDEDLWVCDEDGVILARYWEAKLREKNT